MTKSKALITTTNKQRTIAKEVILKGVGLHTGQDVTMKFVPAPENHGYAFKRIDLEGQPVIEADANYVINTQRGTNLEKNGVQSDVYRLGVSITGLEAWW